MERRNTIGWDVVHGGPAAGAVAHRPRALRRPRRRHASSSSAGGERRHREAVTKLFSASGEYEYAAALPPSVASTDCRCLGPKLEYAVRHRDASTPTLTRIRTPRTPPAPRQQEHAAALAGNARQRNAPSASRIGGPLREGFFDRDSVYLVSCFSYRPSINSRPPLSPILQRTASDAAMRTRHARRLFATRQARWLPGQVHQLRRLPNPATRPVGRLHTNLH